MQDEFHKLIPNLDADDNSQNHMKNRKCTV